jgi:hypothetical protein
MNREVPPLDGGGLLHIGKEGIQLVGFALDIAKNSCLVIGIELAGGQHIYVPADDRERRVQLVSDHRGKVGFEDHELLQAPVCLPQRFLCLLAPGGVLMETD